MNKATFNQLRLELSIQAKNGMDFIIAATIIWLLIAFIWGLPYSAYDKSVLTFVIGGLLLPLAWGLSKLLKTNWKVPDNPLQPLGLWLNFAQLFYFPFLVFILIKYPDYFVMTYVIITGAHFFPYAWFYNAPVFGIGAGVISIGGLLLGLSLPPDRMFLIPLFMSGCLLLLAYFLYHNYLRKKSRALAH